MINKDEFHKLLEIVARVWPPQPGVCLYQIHVVLFVAIMAVFPQRDLLSKGSNLRQAPKMTVTEEKTRQGVPLELVDEIKQSLSKTFSMGFDLWALSGGWHVINDFVTSHEQYKYDSLFEGDIPDNLRDVTQENTACRLAPLDASRCLLIIPITSDHGPLMAATASVPASSAEDLLKLGHLFQRYHNQSRLVVNLDLQKNALIVQIGDSFEELSLFRDFAEQLEISEAATDLSANFHTVLPLVCRTVKAECVVLVFEPRLQDGELPDSPGGIPVDRFVWSGKHTIENNVCLQVIEHFKSRAATQPVVVNRLNETSKSADLPGVRDLILTRMAKGGYQMGWLIAFNRTLRQGLDELGGRLPLSQFEFGSSEANVLSCTARMLAAHWRNVQQFREKEQLLVNMVRVMVSAIEAKDEYTSGHSERVALYSRRLGRALGLHESECERLYLTGLVHDVGKIGVSGATLRKTGKLTDKEFEEIKRHPEVGWSILQELDQLRYVLPGVVHHHESCDGKGYPDGLAGEDIPRDGRIIAIADAYDAMTSDRPYRQGMSCEQALSILCDGSGSQWDPHMVQTFVNISADIMKTQQNYCRTSPPVRCTGNTNAQHGNEKKPRRQPGYTLIEMVTVLMITTILAGVTFPHFLDSLAHHRLESAAQRIESDLKLARDRAIASSSNCGAKFYVAENLYVLYPDIVNPDHPTEPYSTRLSREPYYCRLVSVDFGGDNEVVFNGHGIPDSNGSIRVEHRRKQRLILLNGSTGEILVQ